MEEKLCTRCGVVKPAAEYHSNKSRLDGLQSYCKECKGKMDQKTYLGNKTAYVARNKKSRQLLKDEVNAIKAAAGCKYCSEKDFCCLEFHHTNSEDKEATISKFVQTASRRKVFKEIAKCDVVCSNCHRKLHAGRKLQNNLGSALAGPKAESTADRTPFCV